MAIIDEQEYNKPFTLSIWKKVLPYLKPYKNKFIGVGALMLFSAVVDACLPLFQRYALNVYIAEGHVNGILGFVLLYTTIIILQVIGVVIFSVQTMQIDLCVSRDMKRSCFIKLQELSLSYYNVTPVGYTHTRIMSDTLKISSIVAWTFVDILWQGFYIIAVFVAMLILNYKLALIVLIIVPLIVILTTIFQKKILHYNRQIRKINSKITNGYNESITSQKTSKTLVIEEQNFSLFKKDTQSMYRASTKSAILSAIYIPTILMLSSCVMAIVLSQGSALAIEQVLEIGTLSVFIVFAISIFEPIQQLARLIAEFISTQANIERVFDLLEQVPNVVDSDEVIEKYGTCFEPKKENWEQIKGNIEFKNVWFKYPDGHEFVLEDFSLNIKAGTTVAIVGETGAGKSTLVNLACRFFEPTRGEILIDGINYKERSQLWLHSNIGYVLQNPHLFSGSIRENIRYGKLDATESQILDAAQKVSADTIVKKLDNGYESEVGESGDMLSTGEKQVISFARAVLADPKIFVLDEATSSIDTQTEQLIQGAISHLLQNRTSFLIAHRLSTIQKADLILVVKDGKIIEQGTHRELLDSNGHYCHLYKSQFEQEEVRKLGDKKRD